MSCVFVVVMDWTETRAPPPTGTSPTMMRRVCLRGNGDAATSGIPRLISLTVSLSRTVAFLPTRTTNAWSESLLEADV